MIQTETELHSTHELSNPGSPPQSLILVILIFKFLPTNSTSMALIQTMCSGYFHCIIFEFLDLVFRCHNITPRVMQ